MGIQLETSILYDEKPEEEDPFKNLEVEDFESPIVGNLMAARNFDGNASALERGVANNFFEKGLLGHPILSEKVRKELTESYERKNEIAEAIKNSYAESGDSYFDDIEEYTESEYQLLIEATKRRIEEYERLEKLRVITGVIPGLKAALSSKKLSFAKNN